MDPEVFVHYRTGLAPVDKVHWDLLSHMKAIVRGDKSTGVALATELRMHMCDEELFMSRIGYPYRSMHVESHRSLIKKLDLITPEQTPKFCQLTVESVYLLYMSHIDHYDRAFAEFITRHKLT